ncbi:MAG: hypothetical protein AUK47_10880 [Deltaproteobacteria bacterium CG2_30_63_29]|nr:MAG: hypothetical protein AUK47_10880 [Deltaproteobacteria bacterium CG2_30_63_29]
MRNARWLSTVLVLGVLWGTAWLLPVKEAMSGDVPADRQVLILARALAYDRNLKDKAGDAVTIALVYKDGDGASKSQMQEISAAIASGKKLRISGLPIKTVVVAFGIEDLDSTLTNEGVDAVYICSGLANDLDSITALTRQKQIASLADDKVYAKQGVSVVVVAEGQKASLVINLKASKAEGLDLSSELLELAEVIK